MGMCGPSLFIDIYDYFSSAGQDRFRGLMPQYTRRSAAAIVMCDVTRKDTLEGAKLWKQSVDKQGGDTA